MIVRNRTNNTPAVTMVVTWAALLKTINGTILEVERKDFMTVKVNGSIAQEIPKQFYDAVILVLKSEMGYNQYKYNSEISGLISILEGDVIEYFDCVIGSNDSVINIRKADLRNQDLGDQMIEKLPN